ncbi:MAG: TolB family protein [Acidimicrobiia bacterium]
MGRYFSCALLAFLVGLVGCDDGSSDDAAGKAPPAPDTFFAVVGFDTRIVEVATATGEVLRTVVDLSDSEATGGQEPDSIGSLDVDADRNTLYFAVGLSGPLYRLQLPDSSPERIGDGNGITVSPDGRRLAFARRRDLVVRDLPGGKEKVFEGFIGDLGGRPGAWAADSRTLAVEIDGADVTHVVVLDTATGETTELKTRAGDPHNYTPTAGWFRASDGLLAVVCCTSGEIDPNAPSTTPELVLHDSTTGEERDRSPLRLPGGGYDYDFSRTHQLLTSDDAVYWRSDREISRIPGIAGARLAVW